MEWNEMSISKSIPVPLIGQSDYMALLNSELVFSRNFSAASSTAPPAPGLKHGPNGTMFLSSGIPDLDKILGGGGWFTTNLLFYASSAKDPRGFLGTLPNPMVSKDDKSRVHETEQEKGLRIAWQYKKYFGEHNSESQRDGKSEYCSNFDLRKPLERHFFSGQRIDCVSLKESADLATFQEHCSAQTPRYYHYNGNISGGHIAIQSLCSPQCEFSNKMEMSPVKDMFTCRRSGDACFYQISEKFGQIVKCCSSYNLCAFACFNSLLQKLQHLADTLVSVKAIPDEDKELAKLLTGYQDMVGLLSVHKVARINTQVPAILEATTFSMKLQKRRSLILECLNQAP
ncbi:Elongator complex protein 4 [Sesamum angolense]|uniref:Elongator complex protein 4 n=1 Tax=Sesamum angolense TaxID=2727404 RepID=A0AAE2C7C0_9LAMI|nr:Elongator complex protein 4 [Sesamum angolense]